MNRVVISDGVQRFTRISKQAARKRFAKGEFTYIIAHKMRPGYPFSLGMMFGPVPEAECGSDYQKSFDGQVQNFEWYNANCHETGTYAAFYVTEDSAHG